MNLVGLYVQRWPYWRGAEHRGPESRRGEDRTAQLLEGETEARKVVVVSIVRRKWQAVFGCLCILYILCVCDHGLGSQKRQRSGAEESRLVDQGEASTLYCWLDRAGIEPKIASGTTS
jgi:hypothetical protein